MPYGSCREVSNLESGSSLPNKADGKAVCDVAPKWGSGSYQKSIRLKPVHRNSDNHDRHYRDQYILSNFVHLQWMQVGTNSGIAIAHRGQMSLRRRRRRIKARARRGRDGGGL